MTRKPLFYRFLRLPLLLTAAIALAAGCEKPAPPQTAAAFVLPEPAPVSNFELRHHTSGQWV